VRRRTPLTRTSEAEAPERERGPLRGPQRRSPPDRMTKLGPQARPTPPARRLAPTRTAPAPRPYASSLCTLGRAPTAHRDPFIAGIAGEIADVSAADCVNNGEDCPGWPQRDEGEEVGGAGPASRRGAGCAKGNQAVDHEAQEGRRGGRHAGTGTPPGRPRIGDLPTGGRGDHAEAQQQ